MAEKISNKLILKGYAVIDESGTNQIFPILPNTLIKQLEEQFSFYIWNKIDEERSVVRLVTSWATNEALVDVFISRF